MKTFIFSLVSLGIGGGLGYLLGHELTKKKYRKIADDEVESVKNSIKEYYDEKYAKIESKTDTVKDNLPKENKVTRLKPNVPVIDNDSINYQNLKNKQKYESSLEKYLKKEEIKEKKVDDKEILPKEKYNIEPYVISPEEFADGENDVITLNYYVKDKILADDDFNIIKDIKGTVGRNALNSFGINDADSVYVRNDKHGIDYEILFNDEAYNNVAPREFHNQFPDDDD